MQLEFELTEIEYANDYFDAVLVVDGHMESDSLTTEFQGHVATHHSSWFEVDEATLYIYDHNGEELKQLDNVDYTEYVYDSEVQELATL